MIILFFLIQLLINNQKNVVNYSTKYFIIKKVLEIIKFILLEKPILFFCEDIHILTNIIKGLISFFYPL